MPTLTDIRPLCPEVSYKHGIYNADLFNDTDSEADTDDEGEMEPDLIEHPTLYKETEHEQEKSQGLKFSAYRSMTIGHDHDMSMMNDVFLKISGKMNGIQSEVHKSIEANANIVEPFLDKWYILSMKLQGIAIQVERTVRVRGNTPLSALQDRVIVPAFGWTRGFSPYIFRPGIHHYINSKKPSDPKLDFCFAPIRIGFTHTMHELGRGTRNKIDDSIVCVADLLQEQGQSFRYIHDCKSYGDQYEILISVDDIIHNGKWTEAELISGSGACPPEGHYWEFDFGIDELDYHGAHAYAITLDVLNGKHPYLEGELVAKLKGAHNSDVLPTPFNPHIFDLKAAKKRVSNAQNNSISNGLDFDPLTFFGALGTFQKDKPNNRAMQMAMNPTKCHNCGKSEGELQVKMKRCSACKNARYCSVKCQKAHWPNHKRLCKSS